MEIEGLYRLYRSSKGVSTDSRTLQPGQMFFALRGPQHNGNAYVHQALAQGAIAAVADDPAMKGEKIICVEDVLKTLQQLAAHHRRQLRTTFIAIGGSNGKTTTKELTAAVLHKKFNVYATQGNRNNHIGVPLSLLEVRDATEVAVLEIGANHIGETAFLSELIAPQYGLITNNGKDHLEGYGSVEGVKRGNAELYEYLLAHDGLAFVHADDVELMQMSTGLRQFTYGSQSGADVRGELITAYPLVTVCVEQVVIHTRLTGAYNFSNIMAAVAMGVYFNVPLAAIREALEAYEPRLNRSQVVEKDGNIFLMDAYNANPSSMEAALRSFFDDPRGPKWVMLGDMAELGHATAVEHRAIVELLRSAPLAGGCLVGPAFGQADAEGHFLHFADVQQLRQWYRQSGLRGYLVLVKGSRNQRLEGLFEETAS